MNGSLQNDIEIIRTNNMTHQPAIPTSHTWYLNLIPPYTMTKKKTQPD
jgi:hypothetical protein